MAKKVPIGKELGFLKLSDEEKLAFATPDPMFIELAKSRVVPALRPFLDAEVKEEELG